MKKIHKMNEVAWVLGIVFCALGVALVTKADFGLSMIAAPAYILHVGLVKVFSWYSQGTSEYFFQAALLLMLCLIVRRFRLKYLLSFVTAMLFGFLLDGWFFVLGGNGAYSLLIARILSFIVGEIFTGFAIAFFFRTNLPLQIYELVVTEISDRFRLPQNKVKQVYDGVSLLLSLLLAWLVNHSFAGIGIGTIILTIINAPVIAISGKILDRFFTFEPLILKEKTKRKK